LVPDEVARFQAAFRPDQGAAGASQSWTVDQTRSLLGIVPSLYPKFVERVARSSYSDGLLRFLLPGGEPDLVEWNGPTGWSSDWGRWAGRLIVFGYDWLGRLFAFDRSRIKAGEPLVAILEPGTGQVLEVPENFAGFIGTELVEYPDAVLASEFYGQWRAKGGVPPKPSECVGYVKPLFLGGEDSVENLEIIDLDVYISTCGQLETQSKRGLAIKGVKHS
jgi:hypothetical protein